MTPQTGPDQGVIPVELRRRTMPRVVIIDPAANHGEGQDVAVRELLQLDDATMGQGQRR